MASIYRNFKTQINWDIHNDKPCQIITIMFSSLLNLKNYYLHNDKTNYYSYNLGFGRFIGGKTRMVNHMKSFSDKFKGVDCEQNLFLFNPT